MFNAKICRFNDKKRYDDFLIEEFTRIINDWVAA